MRLRSIIGDSETRWLTFLVFWLLALNTSQADAFNLSNSVENNYDLAQKAMKTEKFDKAWTWTYDSADVSTTTEMPVTNQSRIKLIEEYLGPQKKPMTFRVAMSTVYILILICGLFGNISTCCVIILNNCMHTTTNYYLFSLAVSDVLSLITGLPIELYSIIVEAFPWPFGNTICVMRTFIFETTTIASVLTILTFTFERWLHICKAMFAKKFSSSFSRALKIIVLIWCVSGLLAMPYTLTTRVYDLVSGFPESKGCNTVNAFRPFIVNVIKLSVIFLFVVPMTLISIMYVLIGITLWKSNKMRSKAKDSEKTGRSSSTDERSNRSLSYKFSRMIRRTPKFNESIDGESFRTLNANESLLKKLSANSSINSSAPPTTTTTNTTATNMNTNNIKNKTSNSNCTSTANTHEQSQQQQHQLKDIETNQFKIESSNSQCTLTKENRKKYPIKSTGRHQSFGNATTSNNPNNRDRTSKDFENITYRARQSRRDVVKMLYVVVLGFFICWAPYHSQRLIAAMSSDVMHKSDFLFKILEYLYYISGISIYISSTINPILYNVMSKRYRTAFINTLKMIFSCSCTNKARSAYYLNSNASMKFNSTRRTVINRNSTLTATNNSKMSQRNIQHRCTYYSTANNASISHA